MKGFVGSLSLRRGLSLEVQEGKGDGVGPLELSEAARQQVGP